MNKLEKFNENKSTKLEEETISTNTNTIEIETKNVPIEVKSRVVRDSNNILINSQLKQPEEDPKLKCKFAAIVMDRLFFFVSLFYAIITFVSLIMSIPNLYK